MSNINKQALREVAEKAISEEGETWWSEGQLASDYGLALHKADATFIAAANPATVLALLDELEAKDSMIAAQQHEIRTLLNALEGRPCPKCNGTGMADSGGTQPWGEPIEIECDCRQPDANTAELVAAGIITKVGE